MQINNSTSKIFSVLLMVFLPLVSLPELYVSATNDLDLLNSLDLDAPDAPSWIVQLNQETSADQFMHQINQTIRSEQETTLKSIYKRENVFELTFNSTMEVSAQLGLLNVLQKKGLLVDFKSNEKVALRNKNPNDPLFVEQWNMQRIQMPLAWDIATGGVTADGDTIVVAILDTGFDLTHADLLPNYYYNRDEIPDDGLDNDQNGYADDYLGINLKIGTDAHPDGTHGASVCGIIGAKGNNGKNISGVNWDVKMMLISGISSEADIIEGYQYIIDSRKAYNESNGARGAFIVASNLSAGIDNAFAEDHTIWCNIYDDLGEVGVLNCGATTNKNLDVEVDGDMPTTCTSEYLITVTNTNEDDVKVMNAGYGLLSIDLSAPGSTTLTTKLGGGTGGFPGTSASTPHVAGLIALMYSSACVEFLQKLKSTPEIGLLELKNMIFENVDKLATLQDQTVTGGRINAFESMKTLMISCGGTLERGESVWISKIMPNPAEGITIIKYLTIFDEDHEFKITDILGRVVHSETIKSEDLISNQIEFDTRKLSSGVYYALLGKGNVIAGQLFLVK